MTLVMEERRRTQHQGGPAMSRKLRIPVLAWMGARYNNRQACDILGIPINHFQEWLSNDMRVLRDCEQEKCLANPEIMAKWAEIERKGVRL